MPHQLKQFQSLQISIADAVAAGIFGVTRKTATNSESQGKFPIETHWLGGYRVVKLIDVLTYVESLTSPLTSFRSAAAPVPQLHVAALRERGRPKNASKSTRLEREHRDPHTIDFISGKTDAEVSND